MITLLYSFDRPVLLDEYVRGKSTFHAYRDLKTLIWSNDMYAKLHVNRLGEGFTSNNTKRFMPVIDELRGKLFAK